MQIIYSALCPLKSNRLHYSKNLKAHKNTDFAGSKLYSIINHFSKRKVSFFSKKQENICTSPKVNIFDKNNIYNFYEISYSE